MKKVCVITGTRAEYGLLWPLLKEISGDKRNFKLQIIATGAHLSKEFGLTYREIINDGFRIDEKVDISLVSDTPVGIARSTGLAVSGFARAYKKLKPDILVGLGDRFELFGAAAAALISGIPIAHISGGEVTEGVFDDAFRHSVTKMSHIHLVALEEYRKRVIQMGEDSKKVFTVGSLALDNIKSTEFLSGKELEKKLGIKFGDKNLLVTFHPVTLEKNSSEKHFSVLLRALDELKDTKIIFTKANADTDGRVINKLIEGYTRKHPEKAYAFASMGRINYLSVMKLVDGVVGNSSSGITEAPSFKIATINIGDRQEGRVKAGSVIDSSPDINSLKKAFKKIYSAEFRNMLKNVKNPYGKGSAAKTIAKILRNLKLKDTLKKRFHDIQFRIKR